MDHVKNFHSLPSLYFFFLFSFGICLAWFLGDLFNLTLLIAVYFSLLISLLFFFRRNQSFLYTVFFIVILAGLIRMWLALYAVGPKEMNLFLQDYEAFQGTIINADYRDLKANVYILKCEKVIVKGKDISSSGLIVINQGKYKQRFNYGDVIRIDGQAQFPALPTNPGDFNYRRYLQLNDQFFYFRLAKETNVAKIFFDKGNWSQSYIFNPVRNYIRQVIDDHLSQHSPSIVKALILGERGNLDKGIISDFQKTGIIHVLAISGLHVGFIALMLQFALSLLRVPKKMVMATVILFLILFVALVNFKAPVLRASLMMSFYYLSKFTSRPQKPLNVIALAGLLILIVQPEQLLLPGFQYSFAAVFGLIYGSDKLNGLFPYFRFSKKIAPFINRNIRTPFVASLSAILATLPLTWYYFGSFQIGAIIANIFIIPYIALVLFLSILFISFSWVLFFPAAGIALVIDILVDLMINIVSVFALLPFIQFITGHPNVFYIILSVISIFLIFNFRVVKARIGLIVISAIGLLVFFSSFSSRDNLRITFIHVGQGDATLLQFPNGKAALVDAGNKGFGFDAGERYVDPVLKYYGLPKVDYLIASHPHSDHIGGFEYILQNYSVDTLILGEFQLESKLYKRILEIAKQKSVFLKEVDCGDIINIDSQTRLYVLHPTDFFEHGSHKSGEIVNNSSLVIKLVHGNNSILLNGDAEEDAEQTISRYRAFLDCDLLKVGHHGSKTSSSNLFLDLAKPEYAVISVGKKNKFNHPSQATILKYAQRDIPVYRTDLSGAVVFESDGKKLRRINWR